MTDFSDEARRRRIWSTQASAACGVSPRMSQAALWSYFRGLSEKPDASDDTSGRLGLACQDGIARMHAEDTGDTLQSLADVELVREVNGVPIGTHLDYWNQTREMLHEVKFFGMQRLKEFGEPGSDSVPMDVLVQCLHEMLVFNAGETGFGRANGVEVNVVFGNVQRLTFIVPWDQEAIDKLILREGEFMALVQSETPPAPQSPDDAKRIWTKTDGSEVIATPEVYEAFKAFCTVDHQIERLESQRDQMKLFMQAHMGIAATMRDPSGRNVISTWKNDRGSERVDLKALRAKYPQIAAECSKPTEGARKFLPKRPKE